jgi:hypothetical protein
MTGHTMRPLHQMLVAVALIGGNTYVLASSCVDGAKPGNVTAPEPDVALYDRTADKLEPRLLSAGDQLKLLWSAENSAVADGGDHGSLGTGTDFSRLPPTWDCLSDVSAQRADAGTERNGMEIFAWRLFIAVNWPGAYAGPRFEAASTLSGQERPRWAGWDTPENLFVYLGGQVPDGGGDEPFMGWWCNNPRCLKPTLEGAVFAPTNSNRPLYDQGGHLVRYEVRSEPISFRTVLEEVGPLPPSGPDASVMNFSLSYAQCYETPLDILGPFPMAVKMAWKDLTQAEIASDRYLSRLTPGPDGGSVTLGLVGFHVMQKPFDYPHWVWSTFEHVDNFLPPPGSAVASFNDPGCPTCRENETQRYDAGPACRTQIVPTPTPEEANELVMVNARFRAWAKTQRSVLQHYRLIGVQYTPYAERDREEFAPPTPMKAVRNSVIEPYLDGRAHACGPCDDCDAGFPDGGDGGASFLFSSCMHCHSFAGNGNKWSERGFSFTSYNDFTFVPEIYLCNPADKDHRWLDDGRCRRLDGRPEDGG